MISRSSRTSNRSRRNVRRLAAEGLEERALMAVVSHWTADNTANDSVGTNHGTLINGTAYVAGQVGQAFSFDGVNDRVGVADSPSLALTQSISIEAWVKAPSLPNPGGGIILFRGDDRGGLDPYQLTLNDNGTIKFQIHDATNANVSVQAPLPLGQFVHVAGTLDHATGEMKLYLNSVLVSQIVTNLRPFGALDPGSNPGVGIGSHGGYPATPHSFLFKGQIDELRLYDHALSAAEISSHFESEKGALQPSITVSDTTVSEQPQFGFKGNLVEDSGLVDPHEMVFGPDGNLYVSSRNGDSVLRYDADGSPLPAPGKTGAEFVSPGAGGLNAPRGIAFGPDGDLYVASRDSDEVLRYSAVDGSFLGALVTAGAGGLDAPRGLLFDGGYLYVTSVGESPSSPGADSILRYDALTGAPAGVSGLSGDAVFVATGSGGLDNPSNIVAQNGDFYVSSTGATSNSVLRYSASGAFLGAFVAPGSGGLSGPAVLLFHSDGFLYVTSSSNGKVLRYSSATGAFDREMSGGLARPIGLLFEPGGDMLVSCSDSSEIRRYGTTNQAAVNVQSTPWPTSVSVNFATAGGTAQSGSDFLSSSGTLTFNPGESAKTIFIDVVDDSSFEGNETFFVNLTNPVGGVIADGQGMATIVDNDIPPTKFFVVDDASSNRTYEYGAAGASIENYSLNSGNAAPRGAASTVAGDKVWVIDANRKVYVYDTSGALLGSWTAGTLANNAQPEGIATNGTDVWIVDNKSDKVFRYAGAATRLSGSQNAASNFNLNSGNTSPKDIVVSGPNLWVVNDAANDKVFKYTTGGSLVGSWTIQGGGGAPTGITLDPASPSHLWIVDSATDRVYQYDSAVSRSSGSQGASTSFALAAGNTNPQGIADPPVAAAAAGWHNSDLPDDVNGDGYITNGDAMLVVGMLRTVGPGALPNSPPASVPLYVDTSNDGVLSSLDALRVISRLRHMSRMDNVPAPSAASPSADDAEAAPTATAHDEALQSLLLETEWHDQRLRAGQELVLGGR
jgi:hypothetical protein